MMFDKVVAEVTFLNVTRSNKSGVTLQSTFGPI